MEQDCPDRDIRVVDKDILHEKKTSSKTRLSQHYSQMILFRASSP